MANINVGEDDFTAVADAANEAARRGAAEVAQTLDRLARKINASLATQNTLKIAGRFGRSGGCKPLTWREVPSVLVAK